MKSFKRRDKNHFINSEGQNLFELALKSAIQKEGRQMEVTVQDLVGGKPEKGIMIFGKDGYVEHIGVEWHSRWCFYYNDRNGRNIIADFRNGQVFPGNFTGAYSSEIKAIEEALINCGVMN